MPGALDGLGKVASDLVTKFGKTAVLTRVTTTQNQATGRATEATVTESVIITPPEPMGDFNNQRRRNTTVQKGSAVASVAALDTAEPSIGDRLTFGGEIFQVVDVGIVWSGENAALYEMGLDR